MTVSGDPQAHRVLNRLDRQLGEAGRREHRFGWLRDVRGSDWVSVDAYYPSNRVVVIASDDPDLLELCEDMVPAHDLYLLTLEAEDLEEDDGEGLLHRLHERLVAQGWGAGPRETGEARQTASPRRSGDPRTGIVLVLVAVLELVIGGGAIGLGDGDYVLGFGLLLDACARVLGAVAASESGEPEAAWPSVLFGSPYLWFARQSTGDAATLAQVTAIIAGFTVLVGLVLAVA